MGAGECKEVLSKRKTSSDHRFGVPNAAARTVPSSHFMAKDHYAGRGSQNGRGKVVDRRQIKRGPDIVNYPATAPSSK
jgi:hypothetical protein